MLDFICNVLKYDIIFNIYAHKYRKASKNAFITNTQAHHSVNAAMVEEYIT